MRRPSVDTGTCLAFAALVACCSRPTGRDEPFSIPGDKTQARCIIDAEADGAYVLLEQHAAAIAAQRGRPARLSDLTEDCLRSEPLPDLDGDGVRDLQTTSSCYWGNHGSARVLYLSNRGCLQRAGDIVDAELTPIDDTSFGVRGVEARWSNGCAGSDFRWTRYRWDGSAFRVADQATCHLCAAAPAPPGANTHPYCLAEIERRANAE